MRKKLAIFLAVIICLDVIALAVLVTSQKKGGTDVDVQNTVTGEVSQSQAAFSKASFVAVGDNLIHSSIYDQAASRAGSDGYDFTYAYEKIADRIAAADVAILNQETIISTEHNVSSYPCFNSPPQLGQEMLDIGFDVFNIATNHSLDKGEAGLISAMNYWNSKNAITTGAYLNQEDFEHLRIETVNGINVAYLGCTEQTNGLSLPDDTEVVLMLTSYENEIQQWIAAAKEKADVVIINVHWGVEYTHEPTEEQRRFAQKLASWGADVIVGTHPHVIQPVEFIDNADGSRTLVAYSLGNFISAQNRGARMLGGMLNFDISKNNTTGAITIENVRFSGVVTHYGYSYSNIRVYPLEDYTQELASKHGVKSYTSDFSLEYLKNIVSTVVGKQFLG